MSFSYTITLGQKIGKDEGCLSSIIMKFNLNVIKNLKVLTVFMVSKAGKPEWLQVMAV